MKLRSWRVSRRWALMRWWRPVLSHRVLDSLSLIEKLNVVCSAQVPRRDARIDPTLAWHASDRDWTVGGFPFAGPGVDLSRDGDEL